MLARIEVAIRPEFNDPIAQGALRRVEVADPTFRKHIRWARALDVYWLDLPVTREELIPAINEVFLDRVLQWLFTGNLIPSAAGKNGGMADLMEAAPHRPGKFWAIERRFRPGVTDNVGKTTLEALEIVLGRKLHDARASSGTLFLFEGPELTEDALAAVARNTLCNELIETWTIVAEQEFRKNDRFHAERVKRDLPKVVIRGASQAAEVKLEGLSDAELAKLSGLNLWALSLPEMRAIRDYFGNAETALRRKERGLEHATDVEMEILAQTWSEHCKHKIFGARVSYSESPAPQGSPSQAARIPSDIQSLFKATISGTTSRIERPWLLSVFEDNAGIVAFDQDTAFCIKVETHNSPSALDPYGGALTGIVGVNRDILGCGLGARPLFNTDVFCVAPLDHSGELPERLLHPRRILDGVRRGVEHGGNKSGIPTVNGALVFDERYLGKPLVYCGTGGFMPRVIAGRRCEAKEVKKGDRICMVGGRIGKDGIHGATFSSLALGERSPVTAVQLGDPMTQKRTADFLLEARDMGLYRALTDNGAGGLSSSVGEMARLSGGARMDVSRARTKYPGLKPYELVVSESQERMTVAVPPDRMPLFLALAERRAVEVSDLGEFDDSGRFDVYFGEKLIASLDLEFLHHGVPQLELKAQFSPPQPFSVGKNTVAPVSNFEIEAGKTLLMLMSRPNIASKEWLIRQYDHEVQGQSVVKPLHTAAPGTGTAWSGPNDASVIKPRSGSDAGLAIGCGIVPRLSDLDPFLMAQASVDEAVRNVLAVGTEFGTEDSVLSICDNFCWPDPVSDPAKMAALVRACYGLQDAALALSAPLVSGKDSMKNDFRGKRKSGEPVTISVVPTLLVTAVGRVADVKHARTSDFKAAGDLIYLLRAARPGLLGSELHAASSDILHQRGFGPGTMPGFPDWERGRKLYSWLGGTGGHGHGRMQPKLKSVHDISDGGLLVSVAESCLARGFGADIGIPKEESNPWSFAFGEGFHGFVVSVAESDAQAFSKEWEELGVPFLLLGRVTNQDRLAVVAPGGGGKFNVPISELRLAWLREGYWE